MALAQEHASVKIQEIQAKIATTISQTEELDLKLELFPLLVILGTQHDLSWWVPGKGCNLERVADWIAEEDYRELHPEEFGSVNYDWFDRL